MSVETDKIQLAMRSVIEAHQVLAEFHAELVAFYKIIDEQLANAHDQVKLLPHMEDYIVRYPADKLKAPQDWSPKWMGRFYYDDSDEAETQTGSNIDRESPEAQPMASDNLRVAFVWIAAYAPDGEAATFSEPECWFGVAHPGSRSRFKSSWEFARYGVWHKLETGEVPQGRWTEGAFPEVGKFGSGGQWHAFRFPLARLVDEERIQSLVTDPLRKKYAEVFAANVSGR